MIDKTMDERVTKLEKVAESLAPLPGEVASMGVRLGGVETRLGVVESQIVQLRTDLDVRTIAILEVVDSSSKATQLMIDEVLRAVRDGDEETRRQMRVLHEDLVGRLTLLGAGQRPAKRPGKKPAP